MKIGLTYDLRAEYLAAGYSAEETAEFDKEETIVALEDVLTALGHATERIGRARTLVEKLAGGARWDLVFNIAEGLSGIGREAQVPAILDVYDIPYTFSDPLVMALTLHKGMTKSVLRDAGVPTSAFAVIGDPAEVDAIDFQPPFFIKPVAEGTGKGIGGHSIVRRPEALAPACARMIAAFRQPVLVERFLPGREFTVGLIGTGADAKILGTMEIVLGQEAEPEVYSYANKENYAQRVTYRLVRPQDDPVVAATEAVALRAWRVLGCRDGGRADLRCDESGAPQFMEVNPLAGLHPQHSDLPILCRLLGNSYHQLIEWIITSARRRVRHPLE